ncbi:hypothetical protein Taro_016421 [Colocasia esculenta]|uniref:Retrotransposon gag domain-containing protein n=1 Tax=Colocasia esculenta TaxID=4460 RepID=A0A843UNR5_COLES|nr:hypothetical protein [Colocasia esculenta]
MGRLLFSLSRQAEPSRSGHDGSKRRLSDRELTVDLLCFRFCCDSGFLAPVLFLVQCYSSLFTRCSTLEGLSTRQVVTVTWDPHPLASIGGSSPGGGLAQVTNLEQKGKTTDPLALSGLRIRGRRSRCSDSWWELRVWVLGSLQWYQSRGSIKTCSGNKTCLQALVGRFVSWWSVRSSSRTGRLHPSTCQSTLSPSSLSSMGTHCRKVFRCGRESHSSSSSRNSSSSGFRPSPRRLSWSSGGERCSRMPAGGQQFAEMTAEEKPPPTPQAALNQPEVPPVVWKQTPVAAVAPEDRTELLERFLRLRPPTFFGVRDPDRAESWVHELERTLETIDYAEQDQMLLEAARRVLGGGGWCLAVLCKGGHGDLELSAVCRDPDLLGRRAMAVRWQLAQQGRLGTGLSWPAAGRADGGRCGGPGLCGAEVSDGVRAADGAVHAADVWSADLAILLDGALEAAGCDGGSVKLLRRPIRRLDQITWVEFLVAFHSEFLLDYVFRERRDLFHELVQGNLTVGQYHQRFLQLLRHVPHVAASEQARTERFISGLCSDLMWAMAGHLYDTLAVAVTRATTLERECQFQPQQSGGSGRSSPYQRPSGIRGSVSSSSSSWTGGASLTLKLRRLFAHGGRRQYRQQ